MGVTRVTGRLICASDEEADLVRRMLPEHVRLSRAEPGCLKFDVTEDPDGRTWHLDEAFADPEAFDAHKARTQASDWGRATTHVAREIEVQR